MCLATMIASCLKQNIYMCPYKAIRKNSCWHIQNGMAIEIFYGVNNIFWIYLRHITADEKETTNLEQGLSSTYTKSLQF